MKKFKNGLIIEGPQSLLKAFAEELNILGYTKAYSSQNITGSVITNWSNESALEPNVCYGLTENSMGHTKGYDGRLRLKFNLPQDWNQALQAANELEEEDKFEVDDYLTKDCWTQTDGINYYRIIEVLADSVKIEYQYNGETVTNEEKLNPNHRKATLQEVESFLVKEAEKLGFKHECSFIAVRDTIEGDKYGDKYGANHTITHHQTQKKENGKVGASFYYNPKHDTLVVLGFGAFIIYEKGVWATLKPTIPSITLAGYTGEFKIDGEVAFGCASIFMEDINIWDRALIRGTRSNIKIEGIKISREGKSDILTLDQIKQITEYYNGK